MLLRKLIVFAITSGLAKKAFDAYRARNRAANADANLRTRSTPLRSVRSEGFEEFGQGRRG